MWLTICNDIGPVNSACRGEHGADGKAWVARLAAPVDGVSVVALPSIAEPSQAVSITMNVSLWLLTSTGCSSGTTLRGHQGRLGLPPKAAPAEGRHKARPRRWSDRATRTTR
jgi:hypothetical protein